MNSRSSLLSSSLRTIRADQIRVPLPTLSDMTVIASPDGETPAHIAGAPSSVRVDGVTYLAYLLSSPMGPRRRGEVVIARSSDGVNYDILVRFSHQQFSAQSLGRPRLARSADGLWRLYVECKRRDGVKRVLVIEALDPALFDPQNARALQITSHESLMTYRELTDIVVQQFDGRWHLWANSTGVGIVHGSSYDGMMWTIDDLVIAQSNDEWCAEGLRPASVMRLDEQYLLYFDGIDESLTARTGIAIGSTPHRFHAVGTQFVSAHTSTAIDLTRDGESHSETVTDAFSAIDIVVQDADVWRMYFEHTRSDGSVELCTEVVPATERVVLDLTRAAARK